MMRIGRLHLHGVDNFFLMIVLVLSIGTLILSLKVSSNTDRINQERDVHDQMTDVAIISSHRAEKRSREADYRICVRQMVTRAVLDLDQRHEKELTLYDCTPNLVGSAPTKLNASQRHAYLDLIRSTPANQLP